jgi:hypothetical protein
MIRVIYNPFTRTGQILSTPEYTKKEFVMTGLLTMNVAHGFGYMYPSVQVVDEDNRLVTCEITFLDSDNLQIDLNRIETVRIIVYL